MVPLRRHLDAKLAELARRSTCAGRRRPGRARRRHTDRGKVEMDAIRAQLDVMRQEEVRLREIRIAEMGEAYKTALASGVLSGLLGAIR
jgi:CHASE3 domain sensor protein